MSENENEYQPYAAGLPVEEEISAPVAEEPVVVVEEAVVEESIPEPEPTPEPTPEPKPKATKPAAEATHVVGDGDYDQVFLKQCVYKNMYARKSLTVHHLQRRLGELGYGDATADRDGWYGDLTMESVKAFQGDNKLEANGIMDATTFERIFAGDPNVKVVLPE
jgi:peptidoglycan hydrolase-like protein with peptidoglycan-binding domain